jgi:hypothetical protein
LVRAQAIASRKAVCSAIDSCDNRQSRLKGLNMKFMNDTTIRSSDEETLTFEVSDEALEAAASSMREKAGAFTMAFCSGVNSCPSVEI